MATQRLTNLAARIPNLTLSRTRQHGRRVVVETPEAWEALGWVSPSVGVLGGAAYMNKDDMSIHFPKGPSACMVYWQVETGAVFTLSCELLCDTGVWLEWQVPVLTQEENLATGYKGHKIRFDTAGAVYQAGTASSIGTVPLGAWHKLDFVCDGKGFVVNRNGWWQGTGAFVDNSVPGPKYMCIRTNGSNTGALRRLEVTTYVRELPGRDARLAAAFNEVEFDTYTLVRAATPPSGAVTFGCDQYGPVWGGFAVDRTKGMVPCGIVSQNNTAPYALYASDIRRDPADNVVLRTGCFFYVVPKAGYMAVRRRRMGGAATCALTSPSFHWRGQGQWTLNLIYLEYLNAYGVCSFGVLFAGLVCTGSICVSVPDDASWDYVCIVPRTTRYSWIQLARGYSPTPTSSAVTRVPLTLETDELCRYMEANGHLSCHFKWAADADLTTVSQDAVWPIRVADPKTSQGQSILDLCGLVRKDVVDATRPANSVWPEAYIADPWVDGATGLPWRWNAWSGWYLSMHKPRRRWYMFDQKTTSYDATTVCTPSRIDEANWGYHSELQCLMRAETTYACQAFLYGPVVTTQQETVWGYCFLLKTVSVPLLPWPNPTTPGLPYVVPGSERSNRLYVREGLLGPEYTSQGVLVECRDGVVVRV